MFTGLVQAVGVVVAVKDRGGLRRLTVDTSAWDHRPEPGDSISVSGCCLTVANRPGARRSGRVLEFDAVAETLGKTTIGRLKVGSKVNLEHSCTPTTLMGGHVVQGHVDGVGTVQSVQRGSDWRLRIAGPSPAPRAGGEDFMQYVAPKGSITVEGVSLTVAGLWSTARPRRAGFEVALIPTTLAKTTLEGLEVGDGVNLEADMIAKTVVHWLRHFATPNPARPTRNPRAARPARR
jgi:riboflavin synthase